MVPARVTALLVLATATLALGMAWLSWRSTAIGSVLFMNHGLADATVVRMERIFAVILAVCGVLLAFRAVRRGAAAVLLVAALLLASANVDQGGYPFSHFAFGAHAIRIATPCALILACLPSRWIGVRRVPAIRWTLILATATTFTVHGLEAIMLHPWFVDLTIGGFSRVLHWRISEARAETLLMIVGWTDLVVAAALVFLRSRIASGWMAFWGLFTALLRVITLGPAGLPETLVRLPHGLIPLAVTVLLRRGPAPSAVSPVTAPQPQQGCGLGR